MTECDLCTRLCPKHNEIKNLANGRMFAIKELAELCKKIDNGTLVEVVRCRECKWFQANMMPDGYLPKGVPEYECRHWCGATDPTDYCAYGERKGGDGE